MFPALSASPPLKMRDMRGIWNCSVHSGRATGHREPGVWQMKECRKTQYVFFLKKKINLLLEQVLGEVDLVSGSSTVDLDFHHVGLLLADAQLVDLGVGDDSDDLAVLLDALKVLLDVLGVALLVHVAGERFLLGLVPALVHATTEVVAQVLRPDGGEGTKATGSLDVANNSNNNHRRALDDGDGLDNLLLVDLC